MCMLKLKKKTILIKIERPNNNRTNLDDHLKLYQMTYLKDKCKEIADRYQGVVGFIGFSNSPSCGLSTGVKARGSTIKAPMHQSLDCPTTEASSMRTEANRSRFLERIKKYI